MTNRETRAARLAEKKAAFDRQQRQYDEVQRIVTANECPRCGSKVRRNLSLTGWWQCEQFGAEGFRKDSQKPACDWQGFTRN